MKKIVYQVALKEKLRHVEKSLLLSKAKLKTAHHEIEKRVQEKAADLITTNRALQAEIIERKKVEKEIIEITQAEQRRFGSQLHDGLCQELSAILVFSKALAQKMEKNKNLELIELKKMSDMLLGAVDQARDTARGLYPGELEGVSLMHSLEELVSNTKKNLGVSCLFYCPEEILIDDNNVATHIFRIAQEGISNAISHGKAKNIEMNFTKNEKNVTLVIKDDGIGMSNKLKKSNGIGLKIMKYRAHIINATFCIKSGLSQGVVLECKLKNPQTKRRVA